MSKNNEKNYNKRSDAKQTKGRNKGKTGSNNNWNKNPKREECYQDDVVKAPKTNDPAWYNNDNMLDKAAKVSFCNALGDTFDLSTQKFKKFTDARLPGVMAISLYSGIGHAKDNTDAVNIAAQEMYTKVRSVQSSAAKYGKQDLMIYYLTVQQALNLYWAGVRALGVTNQINRMNRYMPWYFSEALGFDLNEIAANANKFANIMNLYAKRIAAYAIPANFKFAERQKFLYSNIFVDSTDPKGKYYLFRPSGYFKFALDGESKGKLVWTNFEKDKVYSIAEYESVLNEVVNAFVGDEDFGTMSGDIMKTFPNSLVGWEAVDITYSVTPIVDINTLVAIHNMSWTGALVSGDITQNPDINKDYIVCQPRFRAVKAIADAGLQGLLGKRILDFPEGYPTDPNGVVEATRFMNIPTYDSATGEYFFDGATTVDMPTHVKMYQLVNNAQGTAEVKATSLYYSDNIGFSGTQTWAAAYTGVLEKLYSQALATEFKYTPVHYLVAVNSDGAAITDSKVMLMSNIGNYAILDKQFLHDLNSVCTLSLFSTKNL